MPKYYTSAGPVTAAGMGEALVYAAYVNDHTGKFFENFDANVTKLTQRTNASFSGMDAGGKKSAASIGILAGVIGGITMKLASMGLQAVASFKQLVKSSIKLAARSKTLAISLSTVAGNAGYSAEEIDKLEEAVKANGITTNVTRQILLSMAQANLDMSKAVDLSRVAQDAAVIADINSSQATQRMIHGITTLNPLVLRKMGIIVNLQQEIKKYSDTMGISAQSMDYATKQTLALNAVLAAGERIQGTYEAAMGTAGKQAGSMARHMEELQLAIGELFQPSYLVWIQTMTQSLKDMQAWFNENEEALSDFGQTMGFVFKQGIGLVKLLAKLVLSLVAPIKVITAILNIQGERWDGMGTAAKQALTLAAAGAKFLTVYLKEIVSAIDNTTDAFGKLVKLWMTPFWERGEGWEDQLKDAKRELELVGLEFETVGMRARDAAEETFLEWGEGLGLIENVAEELEEIADNMEAIAAETEGVIAKITELNAKIAEDVEKERIKRMREAIDEEIAEARRREDLARSHVERINDIYERLAERQVDLIEDAGDEERELIKEQLAEREQLEKDKAAELLAIETNYRRTLEDIQRNFIDSADEAARRNDAVAVARLIRQKKKQLKEAEIGRDRDIEDANLSYGQDLIELKAHQEERRAEIRADTIERMRELEEDLAEQLWKAKEQRQKDIDNLNRSLARQKEDKMRHRAWDEEDRRAKYEADIKQLAAHFASLQFIDESGLRYLLEQHGEYITEDLALWDSYYAQRESQQAAARWGTPEQREGAATGWGIDPEGAGYETSPGGFDDWGFQRGGFGVARSPTQVTIAENQPELFAAIPLGQTNNNNYNIHMDDWNVTGVSPQMESELKPVIFGILQQFAQALKASGAR